MPREHYTISIRKRAWWAWLLTGVWMGLMALLLQTAVASRAESEGRAAAISWVLAAALALAGLLLWRRGSKG